MSSNSKSQTHMLVLSNVYSMNKQICFSPIEPTWTPSFVIRGTPPPRFPITLKCCFFIVCHYVSFVEGLVVGGQKTLVADEHSLHFFHFFFSLHFYFYFISLFTYSIFIFLFTHSIHFYFFIYSLHFFI